MSGVKGRSGKYKRTKAHIMAMIGRIPWNKGLTINDPRVAEYTRTSAKNRKGKTWNQLLGKEGAKLRREKRALQVMEQGANWKGGRTLRQDGYVLIKQPIHLRSNKSGYIREQILVMEDFLERKLNKKEVVHHINGIKTDNKISNLLLFQSHSDHMIYHSFNKGKKYWGSNAHLNVEATK